MKPVLCLVLLAASLSAIPAERDSDISMEHFKEVLRDLNRNPIFHMDKKEFAAKLKNYASDFDSNLAERIKVAREDPQAREKLNDELLQHMRIMGMDAGASEMTQIFANRVLDFMQKGQIDEVISKMHKALAYIKEHAGQIVPKDE